MPVPTPFGLLETPSCPSSAPCRREFSTSPTNSHHPRWSGQTPSNPFSLVRTSGGLSFGSLWACWGRGCKLTQRIRANCLLCRHRDTCEGATSCWQVFPKLCKNPSMQAPRIPLQLRFRRKSLGFSRAFPGLTPSAVQDLLPRLSSTPTASVEEAGSAQRVCFASWH